MPYREVTIRGIALLCFPAHDRAFAGLAVEHLRASPDAGPEALEQRLRFTYPRAIVRRRDDLASLVGSEAWYAYRDGRYSPFHEARERWWEAEGCAFLVIETATGRYVDANEAALELIGVDRATLLAMRSGELTDPRAAITVPWVWKLLEDAGELHSTSLMRTPSGRTVPVEYRLVREAAGPGLSISWLRRAPVEAAEVHLTAPDDAAEAGGRPAPPPADPFAAEPAGAGPSGGADAGT